MPSTLGPNIFWFFYTLTQEKFIVGYNEVRRYNERYSPAWSFKMYGTEPRYNEPISLDPWHFVKLRFHCTAFPDGQRLIRIQPQVTQSPYCRLFSRSSYFKFTELCETKICSKPIFDYKMNHFMLTKPCVSFKTTVKRMQHLLYVDTLTKQLFSFITVISNFDGGQITKLH